MPIRPCGGRAVAVLPAVLAVFAAVSAPCSAQAPQAEQAAQPGGGPPACAPASERPQVRAKKVGASWEVSIRAGGWRRVTRLAKQPLGLQRSPDGAYIAYVDRDFRPDGVLVIQRLADEAAFTGELNALPKSLCFSADGTAVLLESDSGQRSPVALSAVPGGGD